MVDIYKDVKNLKYDDINAIGRKSFIPGERITFREGGGRNATSDDDRRLKRGRIAEVNPSHLIIEEEVNVVGGGTRIIRHSVSYVDIYSQIAVIEEKNFPVGIKGRAIRETEEALMEDLLDSDD